MGHMGHMGQMTAGAIDKDPHGSSPEQKTFDDETVWGEPVQRCRDCTFFGADDRNACLGFCLGKGMVKGKWPRVEPCRRADKCKEFESIYGDDDGRQ